MWKQLRVRPLQRLPRQTAPHLKLERARYFHSLRPYQRSHCDVSQGGKTIHQNPGTFQDRHARATYFVLAGSLCAIAVFTFETWTLPHRLEGRTDDERREGSVSTNIAALGAGKRFHAAREADDGHFEPPAPLSSVQINDMLHKEASTTFVTRQLGVQRYDSATVASNSVTEDAHVDDILPVGEDSRPWMCWGVYDGHAGPQVSRVLKDKLTSYVGGELIRLFTGLKPSDENSPLSVDNAIKRAFLSLDDDIMAPAVSMLKNGQANFAEKAASLMTGHAGSCALLCLWDPDSRKLRVACTGDSRAVLATPGTSGSWIAQDLSLDQNGENPQELARLQAAHPNEPEMIKGKRIFGLAVTRAFGDGRWKWDREVQEQAHKSFRGPKMRPNVSTLPYLTAEPEITTTELKEGNEYFVILASDGLWDHMSSQQAVDLVGKWLEWNAAGKPDEQPPTEKFAPFDFQLEDPDPEAEWKIRPEWRTAKDSNAAVHLIRNAFGGRNHEVLSAVLGYEAPLSRDVRDDTTVQVIFFGDKWKRRLPGPSSEYVIGV